METLSYKLTDVLSPNGIDKVTRNVNKELSNITPMDVNLEVKDIADPPTDLTYNITEVDNFPADFDVKDIIKQETGSDTYDQATAQTFIQKYQTQLLLAGAGLVAYLLFKK